MATPATLEMYRCLQAIYLELPKTIADAVNTSVTARVEELEIDNKRLRSALAIAKNYLHGSLGNPGWTGPNIYPIIDAALGE